ncbi:MAG: serine/threonine-protein kinase, partial [Gammaproteobacteria bacterium]
MDRVVGQGSAGVVYAGHQVYLDRPIAVKVLKGREDLPDSSFAERFRREAKILASLRHPHIVECYQGGVTEEGELYLAMEYIDGLDLRHWLVEHGPLTEHQALGVVRKIAGALAYALEHGIIHRDVKPENILLKRHAGDEAFPVEVKLADLGIARPVDAGQAPLTLVTQVVGTPRYMAPEQFGEPDHVDFRADLYALGCVLFQMLTGVQPFAYTEPGRLIADKVRAEVPDPQALCPGLSPGVVDLTRRLLAPDRGQRPESYREVIALCERLQDRSLAVQPTVALEREPKFSAMTAGVGLLCTVIIAGVLLIAYGERPTGFPGSGERSPEAVVAPHASPPSAAEVQFESQGEALISDRLTDPMSGWDPSVGQATWMVEEEGGGINAMGSGHMARKLGRAPWRIDGSLALLTEDSREAGIRIEIEPRGAVVLTLKKLDRLYGSLAEIVDTEGRPASRILAFVPVDRGLQEQVPFSLVVHEDRVRAVLDGRPVGEFPLAGAAHTIVLFVNRATASFR